MKYSLKDREYRHRNPIFPKNQHHSSQKNLIIPRLPSISFQEKVQPQKEASSLNKGSDSSKGKERNYQQALRFVKFDEASSKQSRHGLSPNEKPKTPQLSKKYRLVIISGTVAIRVQGGTLINKLVELMKNNTQRLKKIQQKIVEQGREMDQLSSKCIRMVEGLKKDFGRVVEQLRKNWQGALLELESASERLGYIEDRVNLFHNTLRATYESLRLTRLKQQNLQLQLSTQKIYEKSFAQKDKQELIDLLDYDSSTQSISGITTKDRKEYHFQIKQQNKQQAYLQPQRKDLEQRSPFQANALIRKEKISPGKGLRCWLDDLGCLRRENLSYILDAQGSVVRLSRQRFVQLVAQGEVEEVKRGWPT